MSDVLDTELLQQYLDALGSEGLQQTVVTFEKVIGEYVNLMAGELNAQNEEGLRRQAHKVKGACSSLGLLVLMDDMKHLEKAEWQWPEAYELLQQWPQKVPEHLAILKQWIAKQG
ncbi:Hpt domain-containing protein [Idiomarina xiamenensis]|uniref:Hpt domain-containing protein n=1 Tax=Idiomarina xiamenensis 10-D-4 TaxID=740709 RepID=K2KEX6_9GAMM|nr:Hpt domain-containing protein [Idiomarina xiamenensis]EKE85277.1 Hpt domain-containing protein [Idiomarina xiamenensis 10-D-4]